MPGLTFDTGALIALERRHLAMRKVYEAAILNGFLITVPTVVVAEWWRAGLREKERGTLLRSMHVEPLSEQVARMAGAAVGLVRGAGTIDAIVMASAALRQNPVYTSDLGDLTTLQTGVPGFGQVQLLQA